MENEKYQWIQLTVVREMWKWWIVKKNNNNYKSPVNIYDFIFWSLLITIYKYKLALQ